MVLHHGISLHVTYFPQKETPIFDSRAVSHQSWLNDLTKLKEGFFFVCFLVYILNVRWEDGITHIYETYRSAAWTTVNLFSSETWRDGWYLSGLLASSEITPWCHHKVAAEFRRLYNIRINTFTATSISESWTGTKLLPITTRKIFSVLKQHWPCFQNYKLSLQS